MENSISTGVIPHQVSKGVITKIAKISGIPFKNLMITLDRFGNTGAATIPMALALAFESGFATTFRRIRLVQLSVRVLLAAQPSEAALSAALQN